MAWESPEEFLEKAPGMVAIVKAQGQTIKDLETAKVEYAEGPRVLGMLVSYAIWWAIEEKRSDIARRISKESQALGFPPFYDLADAA